MEKKEYSVPRKFAADILNVSLRTLDRYAKSRRITPVRRGRELFFAEQELLQFKAELLALESLSKAKKSQEQLEEELRQKWLESERRKTWARTSDDFVDVEMAQLAEQSQVSGSPSSHELTALLST